MKQKIAVAIFYPTERVNVTLVFVLTQQPGLRGVKETMTWPGGKNIPVHLSQG